MKKFKSVFIAFLILFIPFTVICADEVEKDTKKIDLAHEQQSFNKTSKEIETKQRNGNVANSEEAQKDSTKIDLEYKKQRLVKTSKKIGKIRKIKNKLHEFKQWYLEDPVLKSIAFVVFALAIIKYNNYKARMNKYDKAYKAIKVEWEKSPEKLKAEAEIRRYATLSGESYRAVEFIDFAKKRLEEIFGKNVTYDRAYLCAECFEDMNQMLIRAKYEAEESIIH